MSPSRPLPECRADSLSKGGQFLSIDHPNTRLSGRLLSLSEDSQELRFRLRSGSGAQRTVGLTLPGTALCGRAANRAGIGGSARRRDESDAAEH